MLQGTDDSTSRLCQQFLKGWVASDSSACNYRIGQVANHTFEVGSTTSKCCCANYKIFLIGVAEQQGLVCRKHEREEGHLF